MGSNPISSIIVTTGLVRLVNDSDLHWLSGLLEGEGSFLPGPPSEPNKPRITICTTDEDVIQRVSALWGVAYHPLAKRESHHRQAYSAQIRGTRAVEWMQRLRPLMGQRRTEAIDEVLASYQGDLRTVNRRLTPDRIDAIRAAKGSSAAPELAAQYGVSKWTIYKVWQGVLS